VLKLHPSTLDYAILAVYFVVVLGIGYVARLSIKTDLDFFLSGRSLPAWVTGLAFIAANLGALERWGRPPTAPSTASRPCTTTGSVRSRR
jgi:solute:Na+ symporter, SSS family